MLWKCFHGLFDVYTQEVYCLILQIVLYVPIYSPKSWFSSMFAFDCVGNYCFFFFFYILSSNPVSAVIIFLK